MPADLTEADRAALAECWDDRRRRFPLSSRVRSLRAILDKLEPPRVVEAMPPPKPPGEPSWAHRKTRRR